MPSLVPALLTGATWPERADHQKSNPHGGAEIAFVCAAVPGSAQVPSPHAAVPQVRAIPSNGLTKAQQSELESARRRAAKALAGKAANAAVSRRAKRRVEEDDDDDVSPEEAAHMQNEEIEAKLANITDAKEAKRLKRCR